MLALSGEIESCKLFQNVTYIMPAKRCGCQTVLTDIRGDGLSFECKFVKIIAAGAKRLPFALVVFGETPGVASMDLMRNEPIYKRKVCANRWKIILDHLTV